MKQMTDDLQVKIRSFEDVELSLVSKQETLKIENTNLLSSIRIGTEERERMRESLGSVFFRNLLAYATFHFFFLLVFFLTEY